MKLIDYSIIKCPVCGKKSLEKLELLPPVDTYICKFCDARLRPLTGDCCVFCSFGTTPCIKMQIWKVVESQLSLIDKRNLLDRHHG